ncbi:MAG: sel1 repeat family protein [Desulfovibrio sp.]|nr:MAG: sel1 repeat family protein [Desulfovibrio sp.]
MNAQRIICMALGVSVLLAAVTAAPLICPASMAEAVAAAEQGDFATAVALYTEEAEQGNADAMIVLGAMYLEGFGVEANATTGGEWLLLAAEQGHYLAQYNVGYLYLMGLGFEQDLDEAFNWFRLSAEQGFGIAQQNLAIMYDEGMIGSPNPSLAYFWGLIARDTGVSEPEGLEMMLDRLEEELTEEQRTLAQDLAAEWEPVSR